MKKIGMVVFVLYMVGVANGGIMPVFAMGNLPAEQQAAQDEKQAETVGHDHELKKIKEDVLKAKEIIVAKVNGKEINMYDLIQMMNRIAPKFVKEGDPITDELTKTVKRKALDRLIYQELAVQEAVKQGIGSKSEKIDKVIAQVKESLGTEEAYKSYLNKFGFTEETLRGQIARGHRLELITKQEIYGKVKVDPLDIKKEYEKYKKEGKLRMAENYVVKDAYLMKGKDDASTRQRAVKLLKEIKTNNYDFGQLVLDGAFITRKIKVDKKSYPAIYKQMAKMKVGETSDVVKDKDTYHIFKVLNKEPARNQTLDEAKGFIENRLRVPAQNKRFEEFEAQLMKGANIEIMLDEVEKQLKERADAETSGEKQDAVKEKIEG